MITNDNICWAFNNLTKEEIDKVFNSNEDRVSFEVHIFNAGGFSTLEPFCPDTHSEVEDNGNIVCDKDDLLMLFKESGSDNPFLTEYM